MLERFRWFGLWSALVVIALAAPVYAVVELPINYEEPVILEVIDDVEVTNQDVVAGYVWEDRNEIDSPVTPPPGSWWTNGPAANPEPSAGGAADWRLSKSVLTTG